MEKYEMEGEVILHSPLEICIHLKYISLPSSYYFLPKFYDERKSIIPPTHTKELGT